jgi:UDP-N-acetylglucosamine--N-acetylmuramyl-(pentapeptide) pyrophosphoryl-undecaprenol N-acetylglucosamine transferase
MKIIISAGGTGGHIFPAIAVADELKRLVPDVEIIFIGAEGKMEMERVPKAGYKIEGLWISGFQRKLTLQNLAFPFKVISSLWKARGIVKKFAPDAVIGFGGFASGPTLRVAAWLGIPTVLQEQNSYAGVTNKLLAQKAKKICVAYQGMDKFFDIDKIIVTGNPVRADIKVGNKEEGYQYFGLDKTKKTIVVLGGSLGARTLNQAMDTNFELLKAQTDVQVLWQCGKLYIDDFSQKPVAGLTNIKIKAFIDRMDLAYSVADVIIARSGALTISELCLVGVPSILVPSPNVAEDHQTKNAMALVNAEAAILVKDVEAKEKMINSALTLLADSNTCQKLKANILTLGKPNAANDIANCVIAQAENRP